ncbi:hypothetical protein [Brucella intermedia]|uniref:hypothetical protein n=1 Tax=Brucella intermedia TaxID=94625 RepID=UPI002361BBA6|nr:hypothetical protein [Brucella intermedia]
MDIDAPEKRQAFGERGRQALAGMVFRRPVLVDEKSEPPSTTIATKPMKFPLASVNLRLKLKVAIGAAISA